ncbi:hypothetical protein PROFUN_14467, partial [Planoprotostelium fungivorum]
MYDMSCTLGVTADSLTHLSPSLAQTIVRVWTLQNSGHSHRDIIVVSATKTYSGLSHEICGLSHGDMQFHVMESSTPVWAHRGVWCGLSHRGHNSGLSHRGHNSDLSHRGHNNGLWSQKTQLGTGPPTLPRKTARDQVKEDERRRKRNAHISGTTSDLIKISRWNDGPTYLKPTGTRVVSATGTRVVSATGTRVVSATGTRVVSATEDIIVVYSHRRLSLGIGPPTLPQKTARDQKMPLSFFSSGANICTRRKYRKKRTHFRHNIRSAKQVVGMMAHIPQT